MREFHVDAVGQMAKVDWTRGENERGTVDEDSRLDYIRLEGRKRRGIPILRWEDCINRGLEGEGGE